jgi:uncharacterized protein YkwD
MKGFDRINRGTSGGHPLTCGRRSGGPILRAGRVKGALHRPRGVRAAVAGLLLTAAGCGAPPPAPAREVPSGVVRYGSDRDEVRYEERAAPAKRELFRRINADRVASGIPPLAYDLLAAKVGDEFCLDAVRGGFAGHWDLAGRPPYLRWALAGGIDFHGENVGSVSRKGWNLVESEIELRLLDLHERMMGERPPNDGHRRALLDPNWTHVGIGVAWAGGELRMTEEFVRRVAEWVEIPSGPLPSGAEAVVRAQLPRGWSIGPLSIVFDPPPLPLSAAEIDRRGRYGFPEPFLTLLPALPPRLHYRDGSAGDFSVADGRVEARIPLPKGPGSYYVLLYAERRPSTAGRNLTPVLALRIAAR